MIQPLHSYVFSRDKKSYVHRKTYTQIFKAALLVIVQNWKQLKCSLRGEWINKPWYIHTADAVNTQQ